MFVSLKAITPFVAAISLVLAGNAAQAQGDAANGASLFAQCSACHSSEKGAPNRFGPNLFGVVGRTAGTEAGYSYSAAMKTAGFAWDENKLSKYLMSPSSVVAGNKMPFGGFSQEQKAEDVTAYLETLK